MENKQPFYIAIDSDVLRCLTLIDILIDKYGDSLDPKKIYCENEIKYNFNKYLFFINSIKNDSIRIVILERVYLESKHSDSLVNFMKKYCYFPNINLVNYFEKTEEATALANAYCQSYILNGKTYKPPKHKILSPETTNYVPPSDATIMAQATREWCCFVTNNGKHFVFDEKIDSINTAIADAFRQINIINGYYEEVDSGHLIVPKPLQCKTFLNKLQAGEISDLIMTKRENDIIKVSSILQ